MGQPTNFKNAFESQNPPQSWVNNQQPQQQQSNYKFGENNFFEKPAQQPTNVFNPNSMKFGGDNQTKTFGSFGESKNTMFSQSQPAGQQQSNPFNQQSQQPSFSQQQQQNPFNQSQQSNPANPANQSNPFNQSSQQQGWSAQSQNNFGQGNAFGNQQQFGGGSMFGQGGQSGSIGIPPSNVNPAMMKPRKW